MRRLFSPLLSLFTVVGGHFLNRRVDLGLLFFALLLLIGIASAVVTPWLIWGSEADTPFNAGSRVEVAAYLLVGALILCILASVVVSFVNSGTARQQPPLSTVGVVGGILVTLISVPFSLWVGTIDYSYFLFADWQPAVEAELSEAERSEGGDMKAHARTFRFASGFFYDTVRYGGEWVSADDLDELPSGDAFITGRISFNGRPAAGVSLTLIVGDRYVSEPLVTGDDGVFAVSVPAGDWSLNRIEIDGWSGKPAGGFFKVVGGPNPPLSEQLYSDGPAFRATAMTVTATERPTPLPELELAIRPHVDVTWPVNEQESVDSEQQVLAWQPFESASRYQLQLMDVTRDGSVTSYSPIAWINTTEHDVPLSDFQLVDAPASTASEYAVKVYAFDRHGALLSDSDNRLASRTFVLRGRRVVDTNAVRLLGDLSDLTQADREDAFERRYRDKKRLAAARTLLDDQLIEAAKILLQRVTSRTLEEERLQVSGMILAAEGHCDEARELLDLANLLRGTECYPDIFTQQCETQ